MLSKQKSNPQDFNAKAFEVNKSKKTRQKQKNKTKAKK